MNKINESKNLVRTWLNNSGLKGQKISAKTINFNGDSCIFVKIHDWKPNPLAKELKEKAKHYDFCIEFEGKGFIC